MTTDAVLAAADALVSAFARNDTEAYFACFHPDATFIFHTTDHRLESRADYRAEWQRWEREDGFHVIGCRSSDQRVQLFDSTAIFTHTVHTTVATHAGQADLTERETIVFHRTEGGWLAVHEHLSPLPT